MNTRFLCHFNFQRWIQELSSNGIGLDPDVNRVIVFQPCHLVILKFDSTDLGAGRLILNKREVYRRVWKENKFCVRFRSQMLLKTAKEVSGEIVSEWVTLSAKGLLTQKRRDQNNIKTPNSVLGL